MDRSEAYTRAQAYANRRQIVMQVVYECYRNDYEIATPSDMRLSVFEEWEIVSTAEPQPTEVS